jgi:hypothetical protein
MGNNLGELINSITKMNILNADHCPRNYIIRYFPAFFDGYEDQQKPVFFDTIEEFEQIDRVKDDLESKHFKFIGYKVDGKMIFGVYEKEGGARELWGRFTIANPNQPFIQEFLKKHEVKNGN